MVRQVDFENSRRDMVFDVISNYVVDNSKCFVSYSGW